MASMLLLSFLFFRSAFSVKDSEIVAINAGRSSFKSIEGALTVNDALILKALVESKCRDSPVSFPFTYAEVGSYLGLSATIVAYSCPNSLIYAHDLFPMEEPLPEESAPPPEFRNMLVRFWNGIKRNNLERKVIPMRGRSEITLQIHDDESLDFGFVDGDHSYEGALIDLRLMWSKLKPGGMLLTHDAVILNDGTNHFVRDAVIHFSEEVRTKFYDIDGTWGLVVMAKGGLDESKNNVDGFRWT